MAKHYEIIIILLLLKLLSATDTSNIQENECTYTSKSSDEDLVLSCYLKTNNFNFSLISNDHITSFHIICDFNTILTLSDKTFNKINKLKEISLINCKHTTWISNILYGLNELRNLTINSYNFDENIILKLQENSFINVKLLERLDLSFNNIKNIPEFLFCPLKNLVKLNLSYNAIVDILDLSFQMDEIEDELHEKEITITNIQKIKNVQDFSCNLDLQILDLSYNHIKLLPSKSLNSLKRLRNLYLNNNDLTSIFGSALRGLKVLRTIDLSNNRFTTLSSLLFKNSLELREIKLQNNSLENLSNDIFIGLEQLLILNLSKNYISSTLNLFKGLIRLVLLDLSYNKINNLNTDYFRDLYTLQILNLEHNLLELLPSEVFSPMKNLHTLILSYNKLAILEPYTFHGLYALSLLSLDNNKLHTLHFDSLRNCTSLQDLNLNVNMLRNIPTALQNMRLLRTVDLGENMIDHINPGFIGMNNLYGLRLHGNQIKNITKEAFSKLPALQILNLARNKINKIEIDSFKLNFNLQAIRLDANLLINITNLFNDLPNLIWLNISDNLLNEFNYSNIPNHLQWLDLHKNKIKNIISPLSKNFNSKLQTLDISYNKIKYISSNLIPNSIEFILLNDNLISTIEINTFIDKPNLTRVDLYSNKIIKMDLNSLRLSVVSNDKLLPEFYIGSNPFYCDCTMEWLQRINIITNLRQHPKVMDLDSIYCKLPYSREHIFLSLIDTDISNFVCEYKTHCFALCHCCDFDACDCKMNCPINCTCFNDQSWSAANIVDCSKSNFNQLPSGIPMDATELYLDGNNLNSLTSHSFIGRKNLLILYINNSNVANIHNHTFSSLKKLQILHLENNYLTKIYGYELQYLENIREIYLQNNRIDYINIKTFIDLKYLEIIRLDGNRLIDFPVWELSINLKKIKLSNNNWSCNCQFIRNFRTWLRKNINKVIDSNRLTCGIRFEQSNDESKTLGPHIADFNSSICSSFLIGVGYLDSNFHKYTHDYFLLLLAIIIAFIFAICIIFIVACQRKKCIKCNLKICYTCKKNTVLEDIEKYENSRLFDAYLTYSIKDREFVNELLIPGLEPQYRLRLHYRDYSIGSYLADIILEGVESSKRTILILSQNFLSSEWKRFEFKSALKEALQRDLKFKRGKNIKRLIIIIYGELPSRDLDPDMRLYLNKIAICIKWGDTRFWEKLRYAMPEIRNRIQTVVGEKDSLKGSLYYCCKHSDDPSSSSAATSARSDTEYSGISTLPDCCDAPAFPPARVNLINSQAPAYMSRPARGSLTRQQLRPMWS